MCGRITLSTPADIVAEFFGLVDIVPLQSRYNIAPSQPLATVRVDIETGARRLFEIRWGLIPPGAKDPVIGNRMINARAETAAHRPAFREALRKRRCLVVADGFYEWRGTGRARQPYLVRLPDGSPFGLAGLWEVWHGPEGRRIESGAILTTGANATLRPIHDRMPVIIPRAGFGLWLDPTAADPQSVAALLAPDDTLELRAQPVTTHVNDPRNDDPRCIEPQGSLF
jgi:putative SOS response-associated peptidase YedK